jgi:hypothetical protein
MCSPCGELHTQLHPRQNRNGFAATRDANPTIPPERLNEERKTPRQKKTRHSGRASTNQRVARTQLAPNSYRSPDIVARKNARLGER